MSVIKDSLYGFVIGDAMGVPIEFEPRNKLFNNPVISMVGYGSYDVPEGTWSDDTSMTLATMDSIIQNNGNINYNDIADRFCNWINNAEYTATNEVFDIGTTTKFALMRYSFDKVESVKCGGTSVSENGNGSLMRMLPIALYCYYRHLNDLEIVDLVRNASSITHAHERSILGCYIYVKYIICLLSVKDKLIAYNMLKSMDYSSFSNEELNIYHRILEEDIYKKNLEEIKSSGYNVDTLEAVFWVVLNTENYNESIVGAINLGGDTDTIGAITGSISGILYGYNSINQKWISKLRGKEYLDDIINKFETIFN